MRDKLLYSRLFFTYYRILQIKLFMNKSVTSLESKFLNDIYLIASGFIKEFDLSYSGKTDRDFLLRWLDFRFRYVECKPRKLIYSNKFPKTTLPMDAKKGLEVFEEIIIKGQDVNPYQTRSLKKNDYLDDKKQKRTDLLWADWGILHFHLTDKPISPKKYFSENSDWLVFCIVDDYFVRVIDIRPHNEKNIFSTINLLEITARSYPKYMEKFICHRNVEQQHKISDEDIYKLRKSGINCIPVIDNIAYQNIGDGITGASTPIVVTDKLLRIQNILCRLLAMFVSNPKGEIIKMISEKGAIEPEFSLCITEKGITVYEEKSKTPFFLPRDSSKTSCFLSELNELIAPEWAVNFCLKNIV